MPSKQTPSLNQWLKIGSIAFGVSCGCTLPFTRHLGLSALIGLVTLPGAVAGAIVTYRHHQQQGQRQLDRGKQRLQELQHRGAILGEQLQLRHKDRQEIELRVSQLHDLAANLNDRIDRDNDRHQQLEQQLATLDIYCQAQENLAASLDRKIQDKQACLLEVDTDLIFVHELDLAISDRQKSQAEAMMEVDRLNSIIAEKTPELAIQSQKLADMQLQLSTVELSLQARQVELDELAATILATQIPEQPEYSSEDEQDPLSDRLLQRELKIAQLELSSRQAELDNLEFKLQQKLESISELDLADSFPAFEPQPPVVVGGRVAFASAIASPWEHRDLEEIVCLDEWYDKFIDNPHLPVLKHIEKHGTITDSEASKKLGNARSVRQFANKLEEYAEDLPFSIRVESSPKGNRYLRGCLKSIN